MNRIDDVRVMQFLLANPRGYARNTAAFDDIRAEVITFRHPLIDREDINTVYIARKAL